MTDRILDITLHAVYLKTELEHLVLVRDREEIARVPLEELAVVIVSQSQVTITHVALRKLASRGVPFVSCDERHMPVGMMLPLRAHGLQAQRFQEQAAARLPVKKRVWKAIVEAKIRAQERLLVHLGRPDATLGTLARRVRSGDPRNLEAQASRRYWQRIFAEQAFRRDFSAAGRNQLLNYGYAVLRAITTRAICAAGLHPSLGIHHHHRANAYCLADDLMEPFRPLVDRAIVRIVEQRGSDVRLDHPVKMELLRALSARYRDDAESRSLFDWIARAAASLASVLAGDARAIYLPELLPGVVEALDASEMSREGLRHVVESGEAG